MTGAVVIEKLHYAYGRQPVLQDLSFSIAEGDFFVIIGPNGSGKTTLMKIMAGIAGPAEGTVQVMGRGIHEYRRRELARNVAFVPQNVPLDFPFTVMEIVLMGRAPYQGILGLESEEDLDKARRALRFTGIEHLADRRLSQLSGGESQRVFIARAICQEPRVMLLDEPTASLDLSHQVRIMDLMEKLKTEKRITVVMVSHDVNLAAMYGNRLLLLDKGRIARIGPPEEVLTYQALEASYGCTLLVDRNPLGGAPRVNLVPGRYMRRNEK